MCSLSFLFPAPFYRASRPRAGFTRQAAKGIGKLMVESGDSGHRKALLRDIPSIADR